MAFRFYIDSQLTDQPDTDMDLLTTIKRDRDLGGMLITQEVTLAYSGNNDLEPGTISGYAYLKSKFDSGTCNEVSIVIYDEVGPTETYRVFTGAIKVPSMKVDEQRISLESKIDDNSYYSYIKNNGNIKFNLYAIKTKNGLTITPPDIYSVDMFDSATGIYLSTIGNLYLGYRLYDVLRFLVPAISDNKVTFESDFLRDTSPHLFLFDGFALANAGSSPAINTSFNEIITELFKLKNIFFYIDQSDPDAPVLRLEPDAWFYNGATVYTFDEPLHIKTGIKSDRLFGTVKVGSEYNPGGATLGSPIYTWNAGASYFGWKEEVYTPYGQCNTDVELNLLNSFLISSNAVNDQVNGATLSNLDRMFLVECFDVDDVLFTASAYFYSFPTGLPYYYNLGLNNVNKIGLHGGNFQSAVNNTQNAGNDIFRAELGQDTTLVNMAGGSGLNFPQTLNPVPFADELGPNTYDPGNNYSSTLFYYTAPIGGDYSFQTVMNLELANFIECQNTIFTYQPTGQTFITNSFYGYKITLSILVYDDATLTTIIDSATIVYQNFVNQVYTLPLSLVTQLSTGNCVLVQIVCESRLYAPSLFGSSPVPLTDWSIGSLCTYSGSAPQRYIIAQFDSSFECNGTPDGAIVLAPPDPDQFKAQYHEFIYDISASDFRAISALPIGALELIKDQATRQTWIDTLQYNYQTGRATVKLISSNATT